MRHATCQRCSFPPVAFFESEGFCGPCFLSESRRRLLISADAMIRRPVTAEGTSERAMSLLAEAVKLLQALPVAGREAS